MRQQNSNGGRRPRGRTNNRKQHGGGQSRSGTYDSNGPDGRIRGNASQVYEKYIGLARDATSASDRIAAEAYYQHAEHYYRIVNDSTDPESPGSQRAHGTQSSTAQQPTADVEGNQALPHGNQSGRSHQDRQERHDRSGRNHQDRRSRGPARDDAEVPGLEPQPDIAPSNGAAGAERASQNELPLDGREGQRRSRGGRYGDRNRSRSAESSDSSGRPDQAAPRQMASRQDEPSPAPDASAPSLEDSIPAAIVPLDSPAEEAPAPRRRGRPRKRPVEEMQSTASSEDSAGETAPASDAPTDAAEAAPAPKRRGRPRKVVVEAAPAAEGEDATSEGPNAANA
ncbi:DUF4167 domain-containing protein [Denitrobaculum tricleocarpae]|uniref:DUF4167 domain-containing protein n=1 Tax=Denitrobaculum tricleocarpae TaxID=2591009 RepID=A0A545T7P9_9PROT|nr:DUF4167 domain-containing protein [Denitrobaculum tricleocarpae]